MEKVCYFDGAASSWPKPPAVIEAMESFLSECGASPGRSFYGSSVEAGKLLMRVRRQLANLTGIENPTRVIFTANATAALNCAIYGALFAAEADRFAGRQSSKLPHFITGSLEHNASIRLLEALRRAGRIDLTIVDANYSVSDGLEFDPDKVRDAFTPETIGVVWNHGSNVTGTLSPLKPIGTLCREKGILLIADAAQTAGVVPLRMREEKIDMLALTGHKSLHGPTGTGALVLNDDMDVSRIKPFIYGGTGSRSDEIIQPDVLPDRFESGTPNAVGLAGLEKGLEFIAAGDLYAKKRELVSLFYRQAAAQLSSQICFYVPPAKIETGTVSFNLAGRSPEETAEQLYELGAICCRQGLHCSPLAHRTIGTFPQGTIRFSFGPYNTSEEVLQAVDILKKIAG